MKCSDLALGTGAIVRRGMKKLAVYRDSKGQLHQCSSPPPRAPPLPPWLYCGVERYGKNMGSSLSWIPV